MSPFATLSLGPRTFIAALEVVALAALEVVGEALLGVSDAEVVAPVVAAVV
jgi:hypothetical protein